MRRQSFLRIITTILAVVALPLILCSTAWTQAQFKTLHQFNQVTAYPNSSLIFDTAGNLYGTTYGDSANYGTVFKLTPQTSGGWRETTLYAFTRARWQQDGLIPEGVIPDASGNLYGTVFGGGSTDNGAVFKLTPGGNGKWTESLLYSFCSLPNCADGGQPLAGLTFDAAGNLYGTTSSFGKCSWCGTVFMLKPDADGNWTETTLYSFNGTDGGYASGNLIFGPDGSLYGTSNEEFTGPGSVFKLTQDANGEWSETVLYTFCATKNCTDGSGPTGPLTFDAAGNLFGTTQWGGYIGSPCNAWPVGCGVVFRLSPSTGGKWVETVLHTFHGANALPSGGVVIDSSGNVYGTVPAFYYWVHSSCCGAVFKLTPTLAGGWTYTIVHAFRDKPGAEPLTGLTFDSAGNLYGTTWGDETNTFGSAFEIIP